MTSAFTHDHFSTEKRRTTAQDAERRQIREQARMLANDAARLNENAEFLPYYRLIELAPALQHALKNIARTDRRYDAVESLIAVSIAEALEAIPMLCARFWRVLSQHDLVCDAASCLAHDEYAAIHQRLQEELTFIGLVRDAETQFENLFPNLWLGPKHTLSGQIADQIDPIVRSSLLLKIGTGSITTETTGLLKSQLSRVVDELNNHHCSHGLQNSGAF